jgi:RimJ/RimL family protein N-acetyltransferase
VDLRLDTDDDQVAEVGFLVTPGARGRGLGTAALRTVCDWGFDALGLTRIVWRAHLGNEASRRAAQRAGFVDEGIQRAGCAQRGERRDARVAARLATDPR